MDTPKHLQGLPHVVVLGAGFAGLNFCKSFDGRARVTLVDRQNHHLFQPLLYQVAMAALSAPEIAEPVRTIFRDRENVVVLMDEAKKIDLQKREVELAQNTLKYDYLVCGLGGTKTYFGNEQWEALAPGLKSLEDAMRIRRHLLQSFERAETTNDPEERKRLMTIVVVGGGPTGVELAGSMAELCKRVFKKDFRRIDTRESRVILVHSNGRILEEYPEDLSESGKKQLASLGVEIILDNKVVDIQRHHVELSDGTRIDTENVLWGAGVKANPITAGLGIELARGGRVPVDPDLSLASRGHPEVFFVGDIVSIRQEDGEPVPGVAPAAIQMGKHVARLIEERLERQVMSSAGGDATRPFRYWDKGMMATIGRMRAVAWTGDIPLIRGLKMTGLLAWLGWLTIHIAYLVGFRNRVAVFLSWVYSYASFRRGARIIISPEQDVSDHDATSSAVDTVALPA
ncbi:NAD(P)/FAD-dependent oxidoreductase [Phycisphaera mikurensis]|uniref:NADH:ubiquinone reductase (non-electrogenic) n=1 Tax=Phycisphaera mikurensis (strain NBRC 102666 / KCTC 22515 / FYK2301M01) TaxID=1142394 RepID=I0IH46_PHYMF|nr:NAD(P)/FAD-dependent oxidoreductase [Phycisphaera mikurensis]MBB6440838.1 NADH dehydrogenase [Phycisphaera mikurensis]BAM04584.1 NADH dehydrogenase [Phycisphaera mikurensis NBRC 102666]